MSGAAPPRRCPRDATDALQLPPVAADRLDAVLHAAGPRVLPALAVLCSAIGWLLARSCRVADRAVLLRGVAGAVEQAARLHDGATGQG